MSIFSKPRSTIKMLEVEQSMSDVYEKVKSFLSVNTPSLIWEDAYIQAMSWKSLSVKVGNPHLLGLAYYSHGHIELRLNQSTRWMNNTGPGSALYGQHDNTPSGTLAHELGHLYEYKIRTHCGKEGSKLFTAFEKLALKEAVTDYGSTDPMEDWAEAYRIFLLNPLLLKRININRFDILVAADKLLFSKTGFKHTLIRVPSDSQKILPQVLKLLKDDR